ncbi:MAG: hypothetical protein IAE89_10820 [Anaerolineae bacterium]|nr:hypothetical protein [Anaerolineae bacterium]
MTDDLVDALRQLARKWESSAREFQSRARVEKAGDIHTAYYYRGVVDTYQRAASALRVLLSTNQPTAEVPALQYRAATLAEAHDLLEKAGLYARDLRQHEDSAFTAIFSRLQPITQEQRIGRLSAVNRQLIILDAGSLPDSGEPYIDFAFANV